MSSTVNPIVVIAVAGAGAVSAAIDLRAHRVPNPLTLGIALLGLTLAAFRATPVGVTGALAGLGVGLALMLPGHVIGATGAGDVKLFAALGTFLGPARIGMAFIYMALAGGAIALAIARRRGRLRTTLDRTAAMVRIGGAAAADVERPGQNNRFAYAPAIALGAFAAALGL